MPTTPTSHGMRYLGISISNISSHNNKMVEGFPLSQNYDGVCSGCLVGKHPEKRYEFGKAHKVSSILDLIHSDVS